MEYRRLGRTGLEVSAVSLGTEYLIDISRGNVVSVIHEAVDRGVNYFDLFFAQPKFRDNMGAAFAGRRDKVLLTVHLGSTDRSGQYEKTRDSRLAEEFFEDALRRYRTDHFDVVYLHNSDSAEDFEALTADGGLLDIAKRLTRDGKARFVGLSSHTIPTATRAVESGEVDVVMFPINIAGNAVPGKRDFLAKCARRDVGLVAMKPYAGGKLLTAHRKVTLENWSSGGGDIEVEKTVSLTPVQCLAYVLAQTGISTVVPGCKDLAELDAALSYLSAADDEKDYSAALAGFQKYVEGECVYCNHCLPCPSKVDIGATIRLFEMSGGVLSAKMKALYNKLPAKASECVECGECSSRCPFGVDVVGKIRAAAEVFEPSK